METKRLVNVFIADWGKGKFKVHSSLRQATYC